MRILVPIRQVAVLDDEFTLRDDGSGVDEDFVEHELNEWDGFSVEAALQLRDAAGEGSEVVVVTVAGADGDEALLDCLAMGADRAIRVGDDALPDGDPLVVARVLAAVVARESPDLVLAGVQSSDGVHGATGIALAGFCGLPHVAVVRSLGPDAAGGTIDVERELEGGLVEHVRVGLPALLTVQTGANKPRYATLRAIKQAGSKPRETVDLAALGLSPDLADLVRGARVRRYVPRESEGRAEMLDGPIADVAARIAAIVDERVAA